LLWILKQLEEQPQNLLVRQVITTFKPTPMKHITLLFFFCFCAFQLAQAQQILSIEISPAEPTVNDTICVIITTVFPSGGCDGTINYVLFENDFIASSLHCLGFLTVICTDIDTIKLNPLPTGFYSFHYTLSSGFGPEGECTPGIVPNDMQSVSFFVSPPLGINDVQNTAMKAYPNPAGDFCSMEIEEKWKSNSELILSDVSGKILLVQSTQSAGLLNLNLSQLESGIYILYLQHFSGKKSEPLRLVKQ